MVVANVQMIEGVTRSSHSFSHNSPIRSGTDHWMDDMKMIFLLKTNPRHVLHFQSESRLDFFSDWNKEKEKLRVRLKSRSIRGLGLPWERPVATFSRVEDALLLLQNTLSKPFYSILQTANPNLSWDRTPKITQKSKTKCQPNLHKLDNPNWETTFYCRTLSCITTQAMEEQVHWRYGLQWWYCCG